MRKSLPLFLIMLVTAALASCDLIPSPDSPQQVDPTATSPTSFDPASSPTPDFTGPQTLVIWMPAQFDPSAENPAAELFSARLNEFSEHHPGLRFDIRLKPATGSGGLLEFLTTASAAAPASMPDLVLFSRPDLEQAAKRNLIHPLENLWTGYDDPGWYQFALDLGSVSSQVFGVPLAADAQVLAYDETAVQIPPQSWAESLETGAVISFPAADPQALLTIAYYLYQSETNVSSLSSTTIDSNALASVFEYYSSANQTGAAPVWLTQLENDPSTWDSLITAQSGMAVTWSSTFFSDTSQSYAAGLIPTSDGQPFAPVTGWCWALAGSNLNRQSLALELADFLTEDNFLASWTAAAGYIPPRSDALTLWPDGLQKSLASQVIPAARLIPSLDLIDLLGPIFSQLTIEVIKGDLDPNTAVQMAVDALQDE